MSDKNPVALAKETADKAYDEYLEMVRKTSIPIGDILDYLKSKFLRGGIVNLYIVEHWLKKYAEEKNNE